MGKRKSSRKVVKKEKPKLDTTFDCLFCNHEKSITVSMDRERKVGNLKCKICSASYQAAIHHLSEPIDVYSEWIDACEEAKLNESTDAGNAPDPLFDPLSSPRADSAPSNAYQGDPAESDDSEIDDF